MCRAVNGSELAVRSRRPVPPSGPAFWFSRTGLSEACLTGLPFAGRPRVNGEWVGLSCQDCRILDKHSPLLEADGKWPSRGGGLRTSASHTTM